jgi:hypothetical protein
MVDQNILLDALQTSAGATNSAKKQEDTLTRVLQQMGLLQQESVGSTDRATAAINTVEGTALSGQQRAQDDARTYAASVGALGTSPEALLVRLGVDLNSQLEASKSARDNLVAKQSINLMDNPLGWLHAQMTVEADQANYNIAQQAAAGISKDIATATQAVDSFGRTQAALAVKVTDASRVAAADARIAEAEGAKANALRGHLKDEVAIAGAIQNATASQAQEAQRRLGMIVNQEQLALERERFEMSKQQFAWERESKQLALKSKTDAETTKQQLLAQYNVGAEVLGLPSETNFDLLMARVELGGTDKTRISAAMEAGGNTLAAGSSRTAASPAGAAAMMAKGVYPRSNDAGFAPMKKYLAETWREKVALGGGKEEVVIANVNAQVKADAEKFNKNATASGSFYAPPPLEVLTATKSVQATPLYKKVLATAGKDLKTADPEPIVKLAYAAASEGVITFEQAATGLTELYGQAVVINNHTNRYAQIGIPSQQNFTVLKDGKSVNLTDYSATLRALAIMKAQEMNAFTKAGMLNHPFSAVIAPLVSAIKN